jgi:hypothetical protein
MMEEHMDTEQPVLRVNPLLARAQMPGESFTIPSGCAFYDDGEVTDKVRRSGEIHIHPMTALDEIVMRSPDKTLSGEAVLEVFARRIPDVLKPDRLLQKDVDFLTAALRKVSYGDVVEVSHRHSCEDATDQQYSINMSDMLRRTKSIDPTKVASIFTIKLENGQVVKIEPIRYGEVLSLMQQLSEPNLTEEQQQMILLDSTPRVIISVDEVTDKDDILEWIRTIPIGWSKQLSAAIDDSANWGPEFSVTVPCKDCGGDLVIQAPMNPISFFI